jgi:two-component system vancomycin resistance associated response regulator VraR
LKSSPISEIVASIRSAYEGNSPIRPKIAQKIRNEFSRIRKNQSRIAEAIIPLSQLTPTEKEILQLLLQNKKVSEIAKQRNVEISTVKSQINGILKKFNKKRSKEVVKLIKELNMTHLFFQLENYDG